ncbi:MAG: glycerophosphodiester phosphodiesterase [Spirochaetia bacterium]|nr:glycerophosphodiester phosphodiesterase [Spirochaetia bacterium]
MKKAVGLAIFVSFYAALVVLPAPMVAEKPVFTRPHLRIGHRCGQQPEATVFACQKSVQSGSIDILEMDVHVTKDGHLVVMHDSKVDRTTDGTGTIAGLTFEEIRKLDAGYRVEEAGTFPFRGKGIKVSELSEFFQVLGKERFYIEIKTEDPRAPGKLLEAIDRYKMRDRVVIASTAQAPLDEVARLAPDVARAASFGEALGWILRAKLRLSGTSEPKFNALAIPPIGAGWIFNQYLIDTAHAQGIKIHLWTINDPEQMLRWKAAGVDGLMTDKIELLSKTVRQESAAEIPGARP